jgi:hypothetical protein
MGEKFAELKTQRLSAALETKDVKEKATKSKSKK